MDSHKTIEHSTTVIEDAEEDDIDQLRKNYFATLDASIDLLVRNSLCSGLGSSVQAIPMHSYLGAKIPAITNWYKPEIISTLEHVSNEPTNTDKIHSAKSSQFTIENLIKKE